MRLFLLQGTRVTGSFPIMGLNTSASGTPSFNGVKSAFDSGAYGEALQQLQSNPSDDATYYYNLGTTFLKLGKPGQAVAYLEKANRLEPHDVSIQQNLKISRTTLGHSMGTEKLDPASTWSENVADNLRLDEIRGAFGLVGFVIALFWIRSYLKSRRIRQTLMKPAGIMGIGALAITAGLYGVERVAGMNPAAVCLDRQSIRSGPGDQYVELSQCESGMKIRLLGPTAELQSAPTLAPVMDAVAASASPLPSGGPSPTSSSGSSPALGTAAVDPTPATPQLWRQVRYSSDGIGWVHASGLLLL
jgi:hypothetical protein